MARLRAVESDLQALLTLEPLRARVERLRCFRGMDDLTALTIAAELATPRRFPSAPSTMAFLGLVPSELRAWAAQQRLHRKYRVLAGRGKPKQHIVTAVARELTGFVWAALTQ